MTVSSLAGMSESGATAEAVGEFYGRRTATPVNTFKVHRIDLDYFEEE